jgi:hypothetical protein
MGWEVVLWEFPVVTWPSAAELERAIRVTLATMIEGRCRVAWIGAEGIPFCDPPDLFSPDCTSGGVLAWMNDAGDFDCPLDPDGTLSPISDEEMLRLREHAEGLADRP